MPPVKCVFMGFFVKRPFFSSLYSFIILLEISLFPTAWSHESDHPVLLMFQQPTFFYFDLFTSAIRCHGIQSVITPTNCEYNCVKPCWVTHNPQLLPVAHAIVFNLPEWADQSKNFTLSGPNPRSKGQQAWVLIHTESSQPDARRNYGQFLTSASFMQHFDILVSWARNSDVFMPPWELHMQLPLQLHLSESGVLNDAVSLMRRRHDGVLAVTWVSNCIASNNRTLLLQDLMKSVPTHSFGQCLNNARMPPDMEWMGSFTSMERHVLRKENWQPAMWKMQHAVDVKIAMMTRYLFAFVFENSNQRSMVTEKLLHALAAGSIPIYYGAPNVREYLPHPDAAILVNDFKDSKELSMYLLQIAQSERLVRKHTDWRRKPLVHEFASMLHRSKHTKVCEICDAVRSHNSWNSSTSGNRNGQARVLQDDTFVLVDV